MESAKKFCSHGILITHTHVQLLSTDSEELNRIFVLVVAQSLQISSKLFQ